MFTSRNKQLLLSAMLIITIAIVAYLTYTVHQLQDINEGLQLNQNKLSQNLADLNALNTENNQLIESLTLEIQKINSEKLALQNALNNSVTLDEISKQKLRKSGYEDYTLILDDLNHQNKLIPFKGVLGGSMAWRPENSFLLNHKWVYASFDDGHIDGAALLAFKIDNKKVIKWEVINAFLNE